MLSRRAKALTGLLPAATQYVGNMAGTGTTTSIQNQKAFRAALIVLPAPCRVDRVHTYMSVAGTTGSGSDNAAIRIYPADSLGRPVANAVPLYAIDDAEMTTGGGTWIAGVGDRVWTVDWVLPQVFWMGFIHDLQGGGPTILGQSNSGATRGQAVSDLAALPGTTAPISVPQWTETTYDKGASRAWGNAAVTWVSNAAPLFTMRVA